MAIETAPEFHPDLRWLQSPRRVQLASTLRGHVVAVLFWRIGCIHSRHALEDLTALRAARADRPFAVVAVHTPVCPAERDPERVRAFLQLHAPACAVALDPDALAFRAFRAAAWPTLVLVDAQGQVRFRGRGEPKAGALALAVDALLAEGRDGGALAALPFEPVPEARPRPPSGLCFPTGLARGPDGLLWLSDTGHHRLLALDPATFGCRMAVGNGEPGFADGEAGTARFRFPRGLCAHGPRILVADPGNHALRAIDPATGAVLTVCGNGERAADRFGGGFGESQGLCSPWDVCADGSAVRVAMAGTHQLWTFDPETRAACAWLGTGEPALRDGGEGACLQQPLAVLADGERLWVADAGNGALREVGLAHGFLRTACQGLERPVSLCVHGGDLLVADAFAGSVLRVRAETGEMSEVAGGEHGLVAPAGLLLRGGELLVVDSGAHRIVALDLGAADPAASLRPIEVKGVPAPAEPPLDLAATLGEASLCAFADVTLWVRPPVAAAARWPDGSRLSLRATNGVGAILSATLDRTVEVTSGMVCLDGVPIGAPGEGVIELELRGPLRSDGGKPPVRLVCRVPSRSAGDGALQARLETARRG